MHVVRIESCPSSAPASVRPFAQPSDRRGAGSRATPPPSSLPCPAPGCRPRGVYLGADARPGTVVVLVYDRTGERINRAELAARVYTPETFEAFVRWLDMVDDPGAADTPERELRLG